MPEENTNNNGSEGTVGEGSAAGDVVETVSGGAAGEVVESNDTQAKETVEGDVVGNETAAGVEKAEEVIEAVEGEETVEGETAEGAEGAPPIEETAEPVVLSADEDLPVLLEQAKPILDKYDLPDDVKAVIDALTAKAEQNTIAEFSDYGNAENVKTILENHNNLYSVRAVKDAEGKEQYRPNTDVYVQNLATRSPEKADWLWWDLSSQASKLYPKLTKFEESIVATFALEDDTVGSVLQRYDGFKKSLLEGATVPASDIPAFIPENLRGAYRALAKESRDEFVMLDPEYDDLKDQYDDLQYPNNKSDRERKLQELALQQAGINADLKDQKAKQDAQIAQAQALVAKTEQMQETFYQTQQKSFLERLKKEVVFSTNPTLQNLIAGQTLTTFKQAFLDGADGEFARGILTESKIDFDFKIARALVSDIERATVTLTEQQRYVDKDGNSLNPVALNKALREFGEKGKAWTDFADNILKQLTKHTAEGNAEAMAEAVSKQKIALKARPVVKSVGNETRKVEKVPGIYDKGYAEYWVNKDLAAEKRLQDEVKKAAAYT